MTNSCFGRVVAKNPGVGSYELQSFQGIATDRGQLQGGAPNNFTIVKNPGLYEQEYEVISPFREAFNTKAPVGQEELGPGRYDGQQIQRYQSIVQTSNFGKDSRFKSSYTINPGPGNYGSGRSRSQWNKKTYNMRFNNASGF